MSKQWSKQSARLLAYALERPNTDLAAPDLNKAAAGEGEYVSSLSKRVSEVRAEMRRRGGDFVLSKDEWVSGQRRTAYKLIPPTVGRCGV
jgi:hypothetical protein